MSDKDKPLEKGKGMELSGVPLPSGQFSQLDNPSAEPNRVEPVNAFKEEEDYDDSYARDYIREESERLGPLNGGYIANKDDQEWSPGIEDEENEPDDASDEALFPEIQPLHIDVLSKVVANEDDPDISLRPDTIDEISDDFTEDVEFLDETGEAS